MTSFEFSWDKKSKPTGTVFARKRKFGNSNTVSKALSKIPTANAKTANKVTSPTKDNNIKKIEKKPKEALPNSNRQNISDPPKFIKRKQKKEKLAAKSAEENENVLNKQAPNKPSHSLFSVKHKDIYVNTNIPGKSVVEKVFSAGRKFSDLEIHKHLVSNLEKNGYTTLTNVQERAVPLVTAGKNVLIRSQTGSGKTLAYAVPIIDALQSINPRLQRTDGVQAIIIVPTRELALQTHELFGKINTFQWIVVGHLCGGENRKTEKDRLRKGVHVLVATPGRILDHILHTAAFKTNRVRCLILDEADRLLDMGFKKDIVRMVEELDKAKVNAEYDPIAMLKGKKINLEEDTTKNELAPLRNPSSKDRQTVLLSATLNKGIAELADFTMKDHVYVDTLDDYTSVKPDHMVIPNTVKQEFIMTYVKHRLFTLSAILLAKAKCKVFVFMATGQMVDYHHELFTKYLSKMPKNRGKLKSGDVVLLENEDFDSEDEEEIVLDTEFFKLHGSMDQIERKTVFNAFRSAKRGILLCTDVAARGVDVPEADCIIQYTGPQTDEDYLHRVGRTGRAGKSGSAIIFLTHEEQGYITRLQEHKVFLKKRDPEEFLKHLCIVMEEPDQERAATSLQRHYESAVEKNKELHRMGCLAYSSWSRFYNTYPGKMRSIFNFKDVNLGHYVTSFALKETPSSVAKIVRGQVKSIEPRKLNKKLSNHENETAEKNVPHKRKINSVSLTTSEYSSGLESRKKKRKVEND